MKQKGFYIETIFIELKKEIINENPKRYDIIATVFGSLNEVKKDLISYIGKGYDFHYFQLKCSKEILHIVRVMEKQP